MIAFNEYGQGYFVFEDVVQDLRKNVDKVVKAFKGFCKKEEKNMNKLPVAKHLTDNEYKMFLEVYAKHNSSMGLEERKNYTLSHVVKIERSIKKNCLKVYYENGEWWHYTTDGTWY